MMNMLREFKKKRKLMMIFIIVLGFGLAGGAVLMAFAPGAAPPPQQQLPVGTSGLEELIANLSAELEENPEDQEVLRFIAGLHMELANQHEDAERQQQAMDAALNYYFKLIELNPDDTQLMAEVAALANTAGNNDMIQEIFEKALQSLERNPEDVDLMVGVAVLAYSRVGQDDKAQEIFERALQLDGENITALTHYGLYLLTSKADFEGAIAQFEKALEQDMTEHARDTIKTYYLFATQMLEALEGENE